MWMSRQHPSQQDHEPFYASDATLPFTTNREEPHYPRQKQTASSHPTWPKLNTKALKN